MTQNGTPPLLRTEQLRRVYHAGGREIPALQDVTLSIGRGKLIALRGRSGSGKTTLLNCVGGLDKPTSGKIWFDGQDVTQLSDQAWVALRRRHIGFVFQSHALMSTYSAAENVDLMLRLAGVGRRERQQRVREILQSVSLEKWAGHRPFELSGGQQQRVAIARALATRPALILADEPTGELDTATGRQILTLLRQVADQEAATILIATHDIAVDAFADAVYFLENGHITI